MKFIVIAREGTVVIFETGDETASVLRQELEKVGFASVSRTETVDLWLARLPTLELPNEILQGIQLSLVQSGCKLVDILTGEAARELTDDFEGVPLGHGILHTLCEPDDGLSGSEHEGGDGVIESKSVD